MSTLKAFEDWLQRNKPKSVRNYISGYKTISQLIQKYGYDELDKNMNLESFDELKSKLLNTSEFVETNTRGNNMYTATLSNFKLFLAKDNMKTEIPEINKPFNSFGWRWATPGIMSYLNEPQYLKPVLDAILINGNGLDNSNVAFKQLIQQIGENKYNLSNSDAKKISKLDNKNAAKNIIENSANYWYHLGLLEQTGRSAVVSDMGISFLKGEISNLDFVLSTIETYTLPSNVYSNTEKAEFGIANIKIRPLKIILDIFIALQAYDDNNYLLKEDLRDVVVPLSIDYGEDNIDMFVYHIINNRSNAQLYKHFPDCTSQYSENKGLRMLNEYLYFLECFGVLKSDETMSSGADGRKYFLNEETFKSNRISLTTYEAKGFNRIYYGPPGTGKSHSITQLLEDKGIDKTHYTRVTFHPDYDYASFIGSYKPNMYIDTSAKDNVEAKPSRIQYSFVPQIFTNMYLKAFNAPKEDFYLIIEEINRGNCAEIFGDIFQLLDRNPEYDIEPSQELFSYITEQNPKALIEGKMRMPSNLYIIASMNTSDQSLFPMDSAFKRRWEWEYVKIDYKCTNSDFVINLKDNIFYSWLEFLKAVNEVVFDTTKSEDKQIGNWFLKGEIAGEGNKVHRKGIISRESFINKVVFYLWNDVFKDEMNDLFKNREGSDINLSHFFQFEEEINAEKEDLLETFLRNNLNLTPINEENASTSQS